MADGAHPIISVYSITSVVIGSFQEVWPIHVVLTKRRQFQVEPEVVLQSISTKMFDYEEATRNR